MMNPAGIRLLERRLEAHRIAKRIADWEIHDDGYDVYLWQAPGLPPAYYWLTSDQAVFLAEVLDSAIYEHIEPQIYDAGYRQALDDLRDRLNGEPVELTDSIVYDWLAEHSTRMDDSDGTWRKS